MFGQHRVAKVGQTWTWLQQRKGCFPTMQVAYTLILINAKCWRGLGYEVNWTRLPFWHDEPARLSLMHTPSMDAKRKQLLRFKRKINKSEQHVEDQTCCLEQNWSDSLPGISVLFLQYVASTFSTVSHQNWFYTWNDVLHKMLISWPIHADFKWTPIKCLRERVSGAQCCSGSCFSIVHLTKKNNF